MSDYGEENLCPKCGQISASFEMCDNCGALLDRMRNRAEQSPHEQPEEIPTGEAYAPGGFYDEPPPRQWLTIIAVCVLVVGGIGGFVLAKRHRAEDRAANSRVASAAVTSDNASAATDDASGAGEEPAPGSSAVATEAPAAPTETPLHPNATVTPGSSAPKVPAVDPASTPGAKAANLLGWLSNLKTPAAAANSTPVAAATPATTPAATPVPVATRSTGARGAAAKAKSTAASRNINIGEEVFSDASAQPDRVAEVIHRLDSQQATPSAGEQPAASPAQQQVARLGIISVDDTNFQTEVMSYTETPVLLAFYSPDVPNSNSTAPVLLSLAQQGNPKIKIAVVDVNQAKGVKQRYVVDQLPMAVLVIKGQEFARFGSEISAPAVNEQVRLSTIKNLPH